jgi:hypothetical protein
MQNENERNLPVYLIQSLIVTAFKVGALGQGFYCMDDDGFQDFMSRALYSISLLTYFPRA